MTESGIARNYASAFIESLKSPDDIQKAGDDLDTFAALLRELPALPRVLQHPGMGIEKRHQILDEVMRRMSPHAMTRRFLTLVLDKGRLHAMKDIAKVFGQLRDQRLNTASADVISARPIPAAQHAAWEKAVSEKAGRTVRLKFSTDPALMGGALVRIGDVVYDGSIRKQIARIRSAMLH